MIGSGELIVILCVILLFFGGKRLPEFAKSLGLGIREFKKATQGLEDDETFIPVQIHPIEKEVVKAKPENDPSENR